MSLSLLAVAALASATFSCPPSVEDEQRVSRPAGSESVRFYRGPRMLDGMDVYIGHPSKREGPVPEWLPKERANRWVFTQDVDVWVECTYRDSAAVITYRVGAAGQCSFVKSRGGLEPSVGVCKASAP